MSLENSIKDVISAKMQDGTVEKLIANELEKGIKNAMDNLFRSYGDVTKVIEDKVKSVMIPYLENYDYSEYIVKLDSVLLDVLKSSAMENKNLLSNFKTLMASEQLKEIKLSELYERWMKYVAKEIKTDDLEISYDDGVSYYPVDVTLEVNYEDKRGWSSFENATIIFECEKDEDMNFEIKVNRWKEIDKDGKWTIQHNKIQEISSLRHINEFELLLMTLTQNYTKLIIDTDYESDEVQPEAEPEASFS